MPANQTTVKYVGGMDEVIVYCPTSDTTYKVSKGDEISVLNVTADGLSEVDWERVESKKTPTKKGDA